jgi:hypothetical protein
MRDANCSALAGSVAVPDDYHVTTTGKLTHKSRSASAARSADCGKAKVQKRSAIGRTFGDEQRTVVR